MFVNFVLGESVLQVSVLDNIQFDALISCILCTLS